MTDNNGQVSIPRFTPNTQVMITLDTEIRVGGTSRWIWKWDRGLENHKSLRWIFTGYPPDLLRFVANERRDPVDIRRISTGGIYDFPAQ